MSERRNHRRVAGGSVTEDTPGSDAYQGAGCLVKELPTVAVATVRRKHTHVKDGSFKRLASLLCEGRTKHKPDRFTRLRLGELPPTGLLLEMRPRQNEQGARRPARPFSATAN